MRSLLMLAALLAAIPAHAAETSLPALLRLLPQPPVGGLRPGQLVLAYARVDLLAQQRGPTAVPGSTRSDAVANAAPAAFGGISIHESMRWPAGSGFDFDAIEALLLLETGPIPGGLRLLAGARMPPLAALSGPLAARGFAPRRIAGQEVLARGADNAPNIARRASGDALGGPLALSLRYAMPAPGLLLATREDATMAEALGGGGRLSDLAEMRALAESSAGGPGARDLAQAVVFASAIHVAAPSVVASPGATFDRMAAELRDTDTLPGPGPWAFAMLSERRDAEGVVTRLAIPYRTPAAAEQAAAAMTVRLAALPAVPGVGAARHLVIEGAVEGISVAVMEARQPAGTADTLMRAIVARHYAGAPTPMTIGPVPRAAFAR
jgi:hypothetical protein